LSDPAGDFLGTSGYFNLAIGSKVVSRFKKHHVPRFPRPFHSPDIIPCHFYLFGMLKRVLKDRECNSSDEIEEAIMKVWDELTFDEMHSVFHNWMNRFAWIIENGGEFIAEQI
jgi:hypothetical protein